jgi:hypothetical protein
MCFLVVLAAQKHNVGHVGVIIAFVVVTLAFLLASANNAFLLLRVGTTSIYPSLGPLGI